MVRLEILMVHRLACPGGSTKNSGKGRGQGRRLADKTVRESGTLGEHRLSDRERVCGSRRWRHFGILQGSLQKWCKQQGEELTNRYPRTLQGFWKLNGI